MKSSTYCIKIELKSNESLYSRFLFDKKYIILEVFFLVIVLYFLLWFQKCTWFFYHSCKNDRVNLAIQERKATTGFGVLLLVRWTYILPLIAASINDTTMAKLNDGEKMQ